MFIRLIITCALIGSTGFCIDILAGTRQEKNIRHYNVAIIGAGSAGLMARAEVAKKTNNYVVIDPGILGTTCARVGCMKIYILSFNIF